MTVVKEWAFSLCAAMVVCGIAMQIMPKTSFEGIFKLVVSVFFLCVLLSPVILQFSAQKLVIEEYSEALIEEKAQNLARVMENQTQSTFEQNVNKNIEDKLRQMGINYHSITINININGQSESAGSVEIVLDESLRPQHEKMVTYLENALQMEVRLDYAEKE